MDYVKQKLFICPMKAAVTNSLHTTKPHLKTDSETGLHDFTDRFIG